MTQRLDRIITLQERVVTRDSFGSEAEAWDDYAEIWAKVRTTGVSEQYLNNSNREQARRNAIMRIHYREDIDETMRVVYDDHAWDIVGIDEPDNTYRRYLDLTCWTEIGGVRFLPNAFNIRAGLSDDAIPEAAEFTIDHSGGDILFPAFTNKHILLWRDAAEPELTAFVLTDDATRENQLTAFTKYTAQVDLNGTMGNVWVSNQLLTFTDPMEAQVA